MARPVFVKHARKEGKTDKGEPIHIGEPYYWWKFNFSKSTHKSLTPPTPAQLTQSAFMQTVFGIEEDIKNMTVETLEDDLDNVKNSIEELKDETDSSLQNMPDGLQSGTVGEMLQGRVDSLEDWHSELDNIDLPEKPVEREHVELGPDAPDEVRKKYEEEKELYKEALADYNEKMEEALQSAKETGYSGE